MAEPLVLLNYAFVAIVFSLLLGAGVSQRARVGLCWVAIPGLKACVGTKLLRTYDTVDELTFYASYHSHPMNQLVHIVCVPLLLFTVFVFAAYVPPPIKGLTWPHFVCHASFTPPERVPPPIKGLTWPLLGAGAWSLHHVRAAPLVGSLVSCLTFAMALLATAIVEREKGQGGFREGDRVRVLEHPQYRYDRGPGVQVLKRANLYTGRVGTVRKKSPTSTMPDHVILVDLDRRKGEKIKYQDDGTELPYIADFIASELQHLDGGQTSYGRAARYAGVIHIFCWYMQLHPGHGVFEGRKPALLDSVLQAFLDAPLFVWYEVAFACGYDPSLKQQLDAAVANRHAAWDL